MLAAVNPTPAASFALGQAFAAGRGVVTVGRVEENVVSAIRMNNAGAGGGAGGASTQLPVKLVNMVGWLAWCRCDLGLVGLHAEMQRMHAGCAPLLLTSSCPAPQPPPARLPARCRASTRAWRWWPAAWS